MRTNVSKFKLALTTLTLAALLLSVFGAMPAWAATLNVDTNDPSCNDTTGTPYCSIQAAIDAANNGDTINVAAGTYTEQVTIDKPLNLLGAGETTTTIIAPMTGRSNIVESGITWDYVVAADGNGTPIDVKIEGFTIDANGQEGNSSQNFAGVFFRDVGDGVDDGLYSCTINNFGSYGAVWSGTYNTWMGNYGVQVYGQSSLTIGDNDVDDYTVSGISARGSNVNVVVSSNDFDGTDCNYSGVYLRDGVGTISGNNIHDHQVRGIYLYTAAAGTEIDDSITANTIADNQTGVLLAETDGATIAGNTFTDNSWRSIIIQQDSDNNVVKDNTITMTGADVENAIHIGSDSGGNTVGGDDPADGNTITIPTNTTIAAHMPYAIHLATGGANDNAIKNNTITGGARAIQIDGGNTGTYTISGNEITNDGSNSIDMTYAIGMNAGNAIVTDNTFTNTYRPFECFEAGNITFTGNTVSGTNYFGLNLGSYSGSATVTGNAFLGFGGNGNVVWNQQVGTTVDATGNWWGDTDPSDNVNGDVDYSPWWGDNYAGDPHALPWTWYTDDSIQDAIDVASAGDTINLAAGTYVEDPQIVIDKNLTINGDPSDKPVIKPGHDTGISGDARGWWLVNDGITFNLDNVILDGDSGSGKKVYIAILSHGSGTISNCTIRNIWYEPSGPTYQGRGIALYDSDSGTHVHDNIITNVGRIGIFIFGAGSDRLVENNIITGKGDGGWLDYAVELGNGAHATIQNNTISACRGVASSDGSTSAGILVTTYFGAGTQATITDNTLTDNTGGIGVGYDGTDTSTVVAHYNNISGNTTYGINSAGPAVDAENNWWGDASGPGGQGTGTGDEVSTYVDYDPWLTGVAPGTLQAVIDSANPGDVIYLGPYIYEGGITINKSITLQGQDGTVIGPGSHGTTVSANDVTIDGVTYDGSAGSGCDPDDDGIHVDAGVQNLWIRNCKVQNWCDNGVEFAGAITGLKIVDNYIHDNADDGIEFNGTPAGTVQIYGNAFRSNTGYGVNAVSGSITAEYNEWGDIGGPTVGSGDGVNGSVDYTPWVFGRLYADPASQNVRETEQATVYVKMDVHHLYGIQFDVTFDYILLQLNADPTIGAFNTGTTGSSCTVTDKATANSSGTISFNCNRADTDVEYDATDDPILTLVFDAQDISGTDATSAIDIDASSVVLGAKGGVNIFVDSVTDGEVKVLGTSTVSGVVDLQGRDDDSGAVVDPQAGTIYGLDPAAYTTAAWGTYSFSDMTDDEYIFTVEMPRYLDASRTVNVHGETLDLGTVILLGGDCNDDETIDTLDATILGPAFGSNTGGTGWDARADINDSDNVNILDAVLLGGNWHKSSPVNWP